MSVFDIANHIIQGSFRLILVTKKVNAVAVDVSPSQKG